MPALRRFSRPVPRPVPAQQGGSPSRVERGGGLPGESFLLFEIEGERFAIAAAFLLEVALLAGIAAAAGAEGRVCGAFSHRGFAIPALDLRLLFGFPPGAPGEAARMLVGEVAGERFGLLVDRVGDVVELAPHEILAVPEGASRLPSACFRGVVRRGDGVVLVLEAGGLAALECIERFGDLAATPRAGAV